LKIYVGLKEKSKPAIFESERDPNRETYLEYDMIYGPFKSTDDAQKFVNTMDAGVACGEG
jgi:hypothetical protein